MKQYSRDDAIYHDSTYIRVLIVKFLFINFVLMILRQCVFLISFLLLYYGSRENSITVNKVYQYLAFFLKYLRRIGLKALTKYRL